MLDNQEEQEEEQRDKLHERARGTSEADFKNNKGKFELNKEPGRLPEGNVNVDP